MRHHRHSRSKLLVTLGAAWVLTACSGSSGGGAGTGSTGSSGPNGSTVISETASSDATSSDSALGESQLSEAFGPGDFMLPDPTIGLTTLSGYRASLTVSFDGSDGGKPLTWTSTSVMLRTTDPAAAQVTVDNAGDIPKADPAFVAEVGGTAYSRDQTGTCTADAADPESSLVAVFEPAAELAGVMGAESLGQKVVGGVEALGYSFDERAVGQPGVGHTTGEMWLANDGGYVLAYTMTSDGTDDLFGDGVEGKITWLYELTDVNQTVVVEVPDDCLAGLVDAPMLPDAANVLRVPGLLSYDTASNTADVLAFYAAAGTDAGWVAAGDAAVGDTGAAVEYNKDDKVISIIVSTADTGSRVNVVIGDKASGGDGGGGGGGASQGTATFEMHGGHEASGTWTFAPQFSSFGGGSWTMTFEDPTNPMPAGPFLTLALAPDDPNLSLSEGGVTIIAHADVCTFNIDHQDAGGAVGTVNCTGAQSMGPSSGGIDISITFDVTT